MSVSTVCCYSVVLSCGHTPAIQRHHYDSDQNRKPPYLTLTLMGRHNRFDLSTFGIKCCSQILLSLSKQCEVG